jgi:hypothetical protein
MEQTFKHYLPNFNECWWDSWLLDVAICNAIGIVTGTHILVVGALVGASIQGVGGWMSGV